jgi:hypothetical protein
VARRLLVTASQVDALQDLARRDSRAALTAKLEGLPQVTGLLTEGCYACLPAVLDELLQVTLTAIRWAALALNASEVDVLAALLTGRAAVEVEQGGEA